MTKTIDGLANTSLKCLVMNRKKITDQLGVQIAKFLQGNKTLERLELEGNLLGPESSKAFADLLRVNKTIRYLDLSNNNLTNQGQSKDEVKDIAKALEQNKSLLYLNLSNN